MARLTGLEKDSIRSEWNDTVDHNKQLEDDRADCEPDSTQIKDSPIDDYDAWLEKTYIESVTNTLRSIEGNPTGGSSDYYNLPVEAKNVQDLIESKSMTWNVANMFKACYRLGHKNGVDVEYDLKKMVYFSLRELGRQQGTKDYLTLARNVIGGQSANC